MSLSVPRRTSTVSNCPASFGTSRMIVSFSRPDAWTLAESTTTFGRVARPGEPPGQRRDLCRADFHARGRESLRPFSVAHVEQPCRRPRTPGDLTIRWTRRSRALSADSWGAVEVPLTEELEAGTAVIGGLLSGIAASPWIRAAMRYGAVVLAVFLFLLSLRRSGERAGRLATP